MLKHLGNSWTIFFVMVCGLFLLMISVRPELQARPGHEHAAGPTIAIIGHVLTWASGTVLGYRMIRGGRELARNNRADPGA